MTALSPPSQSAPEQEELRRLREALRKYGRHLDWCPWLLRKAGLYGHECTCGWKKVIGDE